MPVVLHIDYYQFCLGNLLTGVWRLKRFQGRVWENKTVVSILCSHKIEGFPIFFLSQCVRKYIHIVVASVDMCLCPG